VSRPRCSYGVATRAIRFPTREAAVDGLEAFRRRYPKIAAHVGVYRCAQCRGWHLGTEGQLADREDATR
jgi:hypothetical protein